MQYKKTTTFFLSTLLTLGVGYVFVFSAGAQEDLSITPQNVLLLVNESRKVYGMDSVVLDKDLSSAAAMKAQDMFERQYFSHDTPTGETPWFWIEQSGYEYRYAGENLAIHFRNVDSQHKAWMESPLHRKNILNEKYQDMGVAVREGMFEGTNTIITVQLFGTRRDTTSSQIVASKDAMNAVLSSSVSLPGKEDDMPGKDGLGAPSKTDLLSQEVLEQKGNENKANDFFLNSFWVFFVGFVFLPFVLVGGSCTAGSLAVLFRMVMFKAKGA